ncbi:MAG: LA2681 family HEPN domain-containing protein [Nitrospirota bacterium]|nr:LA2681 family HEPN domain-containing protein [Nitrospirota bacterium]
MSIEKQIEKLIGEERYEEALSLCETVDDTHQNSYVIRVQHSRVLRELYRYKDALAIIGTLNQTEESLITEAAIIIDWVSDFYYKNCESPPYEIAEFMGKAIDICDRLIEGNTPYKLDAMYYKANALSAISEKTAYRLLLHQIIDSLPSDLHLLSRTTINLGNSYIEQGRFIEAIELYEKAIRRMPNFSMGWSGFGTGLSHAFYYSGRREDCLLYMSLFCFYQAEEIVDMRKIRYVNAVKKGLEYVLACFKEKPEKESLAEWNPILEKRKSTSESNNFEEFFYNFTLDNTLFLNLCLGCRKDGEYFRDNVLVGGITSKIEDCRTPYNLFSYFSEIRRDYVVARYLLIKSQYENDEEMKFLNSIYEEIDLLDYSSGNLKKELLKMSLQKSVDIFDKIAFFINEYEGLNITHHNVWFSSTGRKDIFKHIEKKYPHLDANEVRNLLALRSISEDLKHPYFEACKKLRDSITHKYLKVHVDIISSIEQLHYPGNSQSIIKSIQEPHHDLMNPKNYHIIETDLLDICLRTLKIARAAILYLSGHVQCSELNKKMKNPDKIIPSLFLNNIHKTKD